MVGHGREVGIESLLEDHAGALAADHAQKVLRRAERGIGRDRRHALPRTEQCRQEHRHDAADEIVMRRRLDVRQHAEADAQRLDRRQPARGGDQLRDIGKGADARCPKALGDGVGIATAGRIAFPEQGRHGFVAARRDQFLERMAAHGQPAQLAVDFAHHRIGHDHAVEAAIHPRLQHRNPHRCSR